MKFLIVCINYNSYDALQKYLETIDDAYDSDKVSVVIADNSENIKKIEEKYKFNYEQLDTGENLGYFGGFSYALKKCKYDLNQFDYLIFSNVDLCISKDFFINLEKIELEENIGCIAPSIYSLNEKKDRNPKIVNRISLRRLKILKLFYKYPILNFIYEKFIYPLRRKNKQIITEQYIYAPHGSFMIFTPAFFECIRNIDYPVFLFGEEIYIAEKLRELNLKVIYKPVLKINDYDHVSTGKMKSSFYYKCNYDATNMLIKEFFNEQD